MLPFVFSAEDEKNSQIEDSYDPANQMRQMEDYYKNYEHERAVNVRNHRGARPGVGEDSLESIQQRLAQTTQAIRRLNEEKEKFTQEQIPIQFTQPPPNMYQQQQYSNSAISDKSSSKSSKRRSRSPSWARDARDVRDARRSRSGSRDRERSRDRDRDRDRRERRSRSRERYHRRRRDRSRSQSRSRSPQRSRHSRRRRSRSVSREKNRNQEQEWYPGTPCNKLAILNMPNDVDNTKITFALGKCGFLPQDVRTMTKFDKVSKQIRTFAFVEFSDITTAERWMDENQGWLYLDDGRKVIVEYARGDPQLSNSNKGDDWICAHCSMNNFVKRQNCFKCDISKDHSMELEKVGAHMVGIAPCDTLIIRSLPDNCMTSTIFDSLVNLVCLNSISMIKLSDSKRFAYIQMKSTDEATMLLNLTYKAPLQVKGKDVQVSYCKDSMSRLIQQQMSILTAGQHTSTSNIPQGNMTGAEIAAAAISKANAVRQASHQVGQMMAIPGQTPLIPTNFNVPPPNMGGPPMGLIQQPMQPEHTNGVIGVTHTPRGVLSRYLPPNTSTFIPDSNSGYYVDPITNFFYDSNTGYYFNNETKFWCIWDPQYSTYFPVENEQPQDYDQTNDDNKKEAEEDQGPKTATDVSRDMLKWAKKQEKEKKKVQLSLKTKEKTIEVRNVFQSEKRKTNALSVEDEEADEGDLNVDPHTGRARGQSFRSQYADEQSPSTVARKESLSSIREIMERALYDESKKMCLLCKRAFPDVEVLRKHVEKSGMHRTNLEQKRKEWDKDSQIVEKEEKVEPDMPKIVYRDRAKERRAQYGIDSTGYAFDVMNNGGGSGGERNRQGSSRTDDSIRRESEEAAKKPLDDNNIGSRLLKNMGWKEGQGVGKHAQGIVDPIQAERFVQGAGLGSSGSKMRGGVEATHKEKTRQALYSRYHD